MSVREWGNRDPGEELPPTPGDEALSREKRDVCWKGEGAAALCGDGETHQVCDRSRTDRCSPELPDVWVMRWESRRRSFPDDGLYLKASSNGCADGIGGMNGGARRGREVPGTGGRTNTVSRNCSGRRRD